MQRHPDNPMAIDVDFMQRIDKEKPGTWIAQPKLDGWRRLAFFDGKTWEIRAKHNDGPAAKAWPPHLQASWMEVPWPAGVGLDMEWVGPQRSSSYGSDSIWVFDLIQHKAWLGGLGFEQRYAMLTQMWAKIQPIIVERNLPIHITPCYRNPGLGNFYLQQLQDPMSEGIVIRRADSKLVGSFKSPADNPLWFKLKFKKAPTGMSV